MKRSIIHAVLLTFVVAFQALSMSAAEYFVNKQGNDGNDGRSKDKSFLTVQKGLDAIAPGDTLTIGPGEYAESAARENLGLTNKATLIRAEIRGTAILRGDIPMPAPRKADGYAFVYAIEMPDAAQCVNEIDTLTLYGAMPNINELEFTPGCFYQDTNTHTLYFSTSDWQAPEKHRLTVSVIDNAGLLLSSPTNVTIDGIVATGFNNNRQGGRGSLYGGRPGIGILKGANTIVRHCTTFLNGIGIAIETSKNCLVEYCVSYGNYSKFGSVSGNICNWNTPQEGGTIRHCRGFAGRNAGIQFYGNIKGLCRLEENVTWNGNGLRIKGASGLGTNSVIERGITSEFYPGQPERISHSLCTAAKSENPDKSNIVFVDTPGLAPDIEFADPDNMDYRLQSTSRFRHAADGQDKGLYPYKPNIFYVKTNGSDSADGLAVTNAWQSLEKAVAKLRPGDTLYILAGAYNVDLKIDASGKPGQPITIGGRGNDRVVINGLVEIKKSAHLALERLNFTGGGLKIQGGNNIKLSNCGFNIPLHATKLSGFTVEHCALARGLEINSCKDVLVSDNIFDNARVPGLTLAGPMEGYIAWNSFSRAEGCRSTKAATESGRGKWLRFWQSGKAPSTEVKITGLDAELYSSLRNPEFAAPEKGVFTLRNDLLFNGYSSRGLPLGPYRRVRIASGLRIVEPRVFAVSATTADIEWRTTIGSTTELQWGDTPACTNKKALLYEESTFHTMSLTGLKPGKKYYFKIAATMPGYEIHGNPEAETLDLKRRRVTVLSEAGELATLEKNHGAATYYVSTNGNDSHSGLAPQASWRTLGAAAGRAGPGDTVIVGGGRYQETVRIRRSGDESAPLRFTCAPGEKAWLDGHERQLVQGVNIFGKDHIQIDGLYFRNYGAGLMEGGATPSGFININGGNAIQITRCFHDGRAINYTPHFINAVASSNLLVQNCFTTRAFGAPAFSGCPGLRVENTVFFINQIGMIFLLGKSNDCFSFKNNIVVDNIMNKSTQPLLLINDPRQMLESVNCFYLRNPEKTRKMIRVGWDAMTWDDFKKLSGNPSTAIFANPQFPALKELVSYASLAEMDAVAASKSKELAAEHAPGKAWDFNDFFAANPELVQRGIGLQPEAFKDFKFRDPNTTNATGR